MTMKVLALQASKRLGIDIKYLLAAYVFFFNVLNFFKYGDPYMFRIVAIEISTYCTRKCSYCPVSLEAEGTPNLFMERDLFHLLI